MATILRTKHGTWRAQVRRKGKYAFAAFRLKTLASEWVAERERLIDLGGDIVDPDFAIALLETKELITIFVNFFADIFARLNRHQDQLNALTCVENLAEVVVFLSQSFYVVCEALHWVVCLKVRDGIIWTLSVLHYGAGTLALWHWSIHWKINSRNRNVRA